MTRKTGPDCAVMCNIINTHTQTHKYTRTHTHTHTHAHTSIIDTPWEDQCEWHRITIVTGSDCAVMYNLIHTRARRGGRGGGGGDESSSGDGNGDENGNGDGNEDEIGEGGRETKKSKKPHKSRRRDQALSFRTRHHLYKQRVRLRPPTATFARPDICVRVSYRGGN